MLVKFKADVSQTAIDQVNAKHGTGIVKMIPQIGVYTLSEHSAAVTKQVAKRESPAIIKIHKVTKP
jgi:hypothetical protein